MKIEGLSHSTILTIMSEVGPEGFEKFKSAKEFAAWLRLAPNNKISGGKILSSRTPKGNNRLKIALRHSANAIGNMKDTHLSDFFRKIAYRKGRVTAVSATARKLAVIIWNMFTKKEEYKPPTEYLFLDQKRKMKVIERIRKNVTKFELKPEDVGFVTA
jgi:transposase